MVKFKIRSPEQIEEIPIKDIVEFAKKNWYWIYPLLQAGWELAVKKYQKWRKK